MRSTKTIAIIGAGPVGLAAAAHALARDLQPIVLEAGPDVGHAVRQWSHVRMFSSWEHNTDKAAERLLGQAGWNRPEPGAYPTGGELIERYLEPLARRTALSDHIRTNSGVTAITRAGFDKVKTTGRDRAPFELRIANGRDVTVTADAVIDASGTWLAPNPAGAGGVAARGEAENGDRIAYGVPDVLGREQARYAGKTVAVLGAGHSALGCLIGSRPAGREGPGHQAGLAAARRQSGKGFRRRRERSARRARRLGHAVRRACPFRQDCTADRLPRGRDCAHGNWAADHCRIWVRSEGGQSR